MTNTSYTFFSTLYIICFATFYLILLITLSYACYRLGYNRSSSFYRRKYRLIRKEKSCKIYQHDSSQDETLPLMSEHILEKEKSKESKAKMMKTKSERQKDEVKQEETFKNFEPLYMPKTCPKYTQKVSSKKEQTLSKGNKEMNESDSFIEFDRKCSPTTNTMEKEDECSTVLNFETDSIDKTEIIDTKPSIQTVNPVITKVETYFDQRTAVMSEERPAVISIEHTQKFPKADHQHESKLYNKQSVQDGLLNDENELRVSEDENKENQKSEFKKFITSSDIDKLFIPKESYSHIIKSSHSKVSSLKQSTGNSKDIMLNWPTIKAKEQPIPTIPHLRLPDTNAKSPKVTHLKRSLIATRVKREINKPITEEKEPFQIID